MEEKPVVIYSAWTNINFNAGMGIFEQKNIAFLSNKLAQEAGYKTILYTDSKSKEILKDIPYNEIIDLDENILNQLPFTMWAGAKLLAMSMQKTPFIHLDLDFLILKDTFYNSIKNKDLFVFHEEPWSKNLKNEDGVFYKNGINKLLEVTDNIFNFKVKENTMSLNFSMFGSCKKEIIPTINSKAKFIIDCLISKKSNLEDLNLMKYFESHFGILHLSLIPVVIEQVIFPNLILEEIKSSYYPIMKLNEDMDFERKDLILLKSLEMGLVHIWIFKWWDKKIHSIIELMKNVNFKNLITV